MYLQMGLNLFGFATCEHLNVTGDLLSRPMFPCAQLDVARDQLIATYSFYSIRVKFYYKDSDSSTLKKFELGQVGEVSNLD